MPDESNDLEEQPKRKDREKKHEVRVGRTRPKQGRRGGGLHKYVQICATTALIFRQMTKSQRPATNRQQRQQRERAPLQQRAAVRVTYTTPKQNGHWKAIGVYIQREAAAGKNPSGIDGSAKRIDVPTTLDKWQQSGDSRLFNVIISPERGASLDMELYTKNVMAQVKKDLGTELEWVGVIHKNTDHPHVHIAIRGIGKNGQELHIDKDYIKSGFRANAQEMATRQLGYRTTEDVRRELVQDIDKNRVTQLDRMIVTSGVLDPKDPSSLRIYPGTEGFKKVAKNELIDFAMNRRLIHLEKIGSATREGNCWIVPKDFQKALRALQTAGDMQKMLHRNMSPASSVDQAIVMKKWPDVTNLRARVLGHGQDEATNKRFMLLEGVDGTIIHLPHRDSFEGMRARKQLDRNSLVQFTRDKHNRVIVKDFGDAEKALNNPNLMREFARAEQVGEDRPGWLGRLDNAMTNAIQNKFAEAQQHDQDIQRGPAKNKDLDHER
jgi:hypothetical protein